MLQKRAIHLLAVAQVFLVIASCHATAMQPKEGKIQTIKQAEHDKSLRGTGKQIFVAGAVWELVSLAVESMSTAEVVEAGLSFREASFVENAVLEFERMGSTLLRNVGTYAKRIRVTPNLERLIGSQCRRLLSETNDVIIRMNNLFHPNMIDKVGRAGLQRFSSISNAASEVMSVARELDILELAGTGGTHVAEATRLEAALIRAINRLSSLARNA